MEFSQNGDPDCCFRHLHVDLPSCKDRLFHHLRRRLRAGICHDVPSGKEFGREEGRGEDAINNNKLSSKWDSAYLFQGLNFTYGLK